MTARRPATTGSGDAPSARGPLEGRSAIVTGAGQGVGRGIALALAGAGARVVCAGRTVAKCETVVDEIRVRGGRGLAVRCDVRDADDIAATVAAMSSTTEGSTSA